MTEADIEVILERAKGALAQVTETGMHSGANATVSQYIDVPCCDYRICRAGDPASARRAGRDFPRRHPYDCEPP